MSSPPLAAPVDKGSKSGSIVASTVPLVSICCFCTLLLLLASTIVLALIPIYLKTKDIPNLSTSSTQYITLTSSTNIPGYGDTSATDCSTISNALSGAVGASGAVTPVSCTFASQSGRRRRAWTISRTRRQSGARLFMKVIISYKQCGRCRLKSHLIKWNGKKFSVSFSFFGARSVTFTIIYIGILPFTGLTTDAITTTTTASTTASATTASGSG
ncbi:unnamed protein product [Rotaria magnacalcarata]|uniref:Uncharacterized protein n=1 Tax=Rotaria magnacalcarata TaxID=392030 RepID=A0A816UVR1_9BILA|nr:unnamed protein product [Rotaria magnacalcarata]CAF2116876.1 unnamed protein product [Rotaria magnacalcarata]CAF2131483.1 unnamed protein product [Rotaria magnacalcarata]CAF3959278.1 unnamed protein product [Rotaria magnacalcarata]CAF4014179.1 unnamed protein product [Rotaria magnacalcarata]